MSTIDLTIRRRDLAWTIALVVLLSAVWVVRGDTASGVGGGPPGEGIDLVYVTVGTNYPDALSVSAGAAIGGAPIILVPTNPPLDVTTINELMRLDPQHVVIIGGTSAVSASMQTALEALLPNAGFDRLAGSNRYATNTLFTQAVYPVEAWASVGALAFGSADPETSDVDFFIDGFTSGANATDGVLYASIQLPDDATVIEFQLVGVDADDTDLIGATLYQVDNVGFASAMAVVASGFSADSGPFVIGTTSVTPALEVVDNGSYNYLIEVAGVEGGLLLYGVRVKYRLGRNRD